MPMHLTPSLSLSTLCGFLLLGLTQTQASERDAWHWSDTAEHQASAELIRQSSSNALPQWSAALPTGNARLELQTMFSAQAGSWPFEPFVNNGLFRVIASHQSSHPQVLVISQGRVSLAELQQRLNDPQVLKPYRDGYLLSYPLMIAADGALLVENERLYLSSPSGAALINQGTLVLRGATLESRSDNVEADTDRPYRPFVMAWAGSTTLIEDSTLRRLGYNAHLSRGLSSARSNAQPAQQAPAKVLLRNSRIEALSAVELQHAQARIEGSQFNDMQQYAIDLQGSSLHLADNRIQDVRNQSGIRVRGQSQGVVQGNQILNTGKAGIEISEQSGNLLLADNRIGGAAGHGVLLRNVAASPANGAIVVSGNLIANNGASGLYGDNLQRAYLLDNDIHTQPHYAISVLNPEQYPGELVVLGNRLGNIGQALIRTQGLDSLTLGNNQFQLGPVTQSILAGETLPLQSLLLDATEKRDCIISVRPAVASAADFPPHQDCLSEQATSPAES